MNMLKKFWNDEAGLESIEYAVIAAVVVLALVGAYKLLLNDHIKPVLTGIGAEADAALPTP